MKDSKKVQTVNNEVEREQTKVVEEISKGKTEEELKEIATTLQTQLQHHQTMAVKAQGALEVISQMLGDGEEST
tara:strand:+ start:674 stop:895 length:222 start_codon:yes stop_codon:yes gene_type:complete